jgi:hypothetical protein
VLEGRLRFKTSRQPTKVGLTFLIYSISFELEKDEREMVPKRWQATYCHATKHGQDFPRKLSVSAVFQGEDEFDVYVCF